MTTSYKDLPKTGVREHLMFLALLIPTFVVIAAAAVSLLHPDDPAAAVPAAEAVAVCEPCRPDSEGP